MAARAVERSEAGWIRLGVGGKLRMDTEQIESSGPVSLRMALMQGPVREEGYLRRDYPGRGRTALAFGRWAKGSPGQSRVEGGVL